MQRPEAHTLRSDRAAFRPTAQARRFGSVSLFAWLAAVACASVEAAPRCPPVTPLPEAQRKFHPGHYVALGRFERRRGADMQTIAGKGVVGVQLRYRWSDLEPEQDRYDFSMIERDLERADRAGLQLVALIEDKSFDGTLPTPRYLHDRHTLRGKRGYTALRWDPFVVERFGRLMAAVGGRFDCEPRFEGVAVQESAPGLDAQALAASGYTPEKYRDALGEVLKSASRGLPRSRVFWFMNYMPGQQAYLGDVAESVVGRGVVMGGPDVLPDDSSLARRTYPFYERFSRRMKLFGSMQHDSYRHARSDSAVGEFWSMEELFLFARDRLHVDYVFWEYRGSRAPANARDFAEAREVIARYPSFRRDS
jgi:hypothetical protein